ncbi:restriction endonuclease subunit S [Phaeobacter gallaeciensis]|uniref:restriction endonuclease subunit S n=1 Tax=Phaeobacter gallaeciensis TaxID=60890 RepID=UPI00237F870C|nr:restriction endonuclease subunit S [Phaeobacter gallaeciensis]MDE4063792.1 restriction endonuclease subunit S [Phaeobacter gallaeciensis]MDE4126831.1 restriction endonuclease subunit S [Phaeobacter gallaeciensis]MDE4131298.1 restriction endonuclease subunit S [Phaeobacter gallaeciensis]
MTVLPNGWTQTRIAELVETQENGKPFQQGWSPRCESRPAEENEWGVVKTTAIQHGEFWAHENKALPAKLAPRPQIEIRVGDVLMTCAGPRNRCGVACLVKSTRPRLMMSGKMYRFRPHPEVLDPLYLSLFIRLHDTQLKIDAMKTGINDSGLNLTHSRFSELPILVPPLNEQRRIVARIEAMFDEIDHGVANLKKAKATLGLYRQSLLKAAFEGRLTADWRAQNPDKLEVPETLLARIQKEREARYKAALDDWQKALADWRAGGENGKKPAKPRREPIPDAPMTEQRSRMKGIPPEWQWVQIGTFGFVTKLAGFEYTKHVTYREDGDLPVIKAENAGRSGFKVTDFSKVASSEVAMLTRSQLSGGELLMVFVGAGTGNVATVPSDRRYFLGPNIGMIRLETPDVLPAFVEHYLRSPLGTAMKLASVKAVAQPSLSMGAIRQIPVALPCPAEQAEITRILDERLSAADALEAEIDAGLTRAEALRQSILKEAFSGKLVPQDPNDEPASVLLERIKAEKAKAPKAKLRRKATA